MIVPMKKYDFILFRRDRDDFLEKLQDLGLVDITTTGWEPNEYERELMISVDRHKAAVERLRAITKEEGFVKDEVMPSGHQAYQAYLHAASKEEELRNKIAQAEKELAELKIWGDFDPDRLAALAENGVRVHYFNVYTKEYESQQQKWSEQYNVVPISEVEGITYFVVITAPEEDVEINAQELRPLTMNFRQKEAELEVLRTEKAHWDETIRRCASSVDLIAEDGERVKEQLHLSQVNSSGSEQAEGTLVILEGWATRDTEARVDELLEGYNGIYYFKSDPTPEDETPVLLRNNKFNRMFEFIGNFYSLPRYGTMDLTSTFGPFYVLFFGLCLADAGYGLIYLIAGMFLLRKFPENLKGVARLVILCGISTMVCGAMMGSFFGIEYAQYEQFAAMRKYILSTDNLFVLALAIGIFQILFAMALKVVSYTRQFGFRYSLATLGWMIVIISSLAAYFLPDMGVQGFSTNSVAYYIVLGIGLFMMLFLNSPGKNPLVNFGAGIWNTYNDVTGLLSDVLSYIRLFAIGLSGGILALVFNQLALGLSPDIPGLRQICIILILVIGHGINLFMSTLSSFVHPMRLTFVEFYKNAGFETTQREFTPLKRHTKQ